MSVDILEVRPGLALFLDPKILAEHGAISSVDDDKRTEGPHPFLCVSCKPTLSFWVVLHSRPSSRRLELPKEGRHGAPNWMANSHYFHPDQIWVVPYAAIPPAAANDLSKFTNRNTISDNFIPKWW